MSANGSADVLPNASGGGNDLKKEAMKAIMPNKREKYLVPALSVTVQEYPITDYRFFKLITKKERLCTLLIQPLSKP